MTDTLLRDQKTWVRVASVSDIPLLGARVVETASGKPVALFRTADFRVQAILDRCPHRGGPLSQGLVHGERVTCPLHSWQIDLNTGEAVAPDAGCAKAFAVLQEADAVYLLADDLK